MGIDCRLKTDCTRWTSASTAELAEKYAGRVPRYTSYPTAPHFHAGIGEAIHESPDTGPVDFDADEVAFGFADRGVQQLCAIAEADFEYDRGRAREQRVQVERLVTEIDAEARPVGVKGVFLGRSDATLAQHEAADRSRLRRDFGRAVSVTRIGHRNQPIVPSIGLEADA
jgi:hypothetical protein